MWRLVPFFALLACAGCGHVDRQLTGREARVVAAMPAIAGREDAVEAVMSALRQQREYEAIEGLRDPRQPRVEIACDDKGITQTTSTYRYDEVRKQWRPDTPHTSTWIHRSEGESKLRSVEWKAVRKIRYRYRPNDRLASIEVRASSGAIEFPIMQNDLDTTLAALTTLCSDVETISAFRNDGSRLSWSQGD